MSTLSKQAPFLVIVILVVLADQVTKAWVTATMNLHESMPVIPGLFSITYVRNPGAAFDSWPVSRRISVWHSSLR